MLRKVRLLMIILGFFALILVGCSSNSDDDVFMGGGGSGEGEGIIVEDILASQGLTLVDKVTYDGTCRCCRKGPGWMHDRFSK